MALQGVRANKPKAARSRAANATYFSTTSQAVDYFLGRFLLVQPGPGARAKLIAFLDEDLGTSDVRAADTYMEDSLRMLAHLIMSLPEYQLA